MKNEKVLICLEKMGIGGVETAVLNQVAALSKRGVDCVVLAENGIYSSKVVEVGAKFIDFKFPLRNCIDGDVVKALVKIIKDENITQVHINQFPCMQYMLYACAFTNVPYVAYLHTGYDLIAREDDLNIFNWYCKQYPIFNELFPMYFRHASKIISITQFAKDYCAKRYDIDLDNILVCPNSIDFSLFVEDKHVDTNEKIFLSIGRLSKDKEGSLFNTLQLYKRLKERDNSFKLQIAGDGESREVIEKYVEDNNIEDCTFLGQISNVPEVMHKAFIVAGVGRCIIDAIASKTLPLIVSKESVRDFVTKNNLNKCIEGNFSTSAIDARNVDDIIGDLLQITYERELEIVNENYNLAKEKLDINKNLFILDSKEVKYDTEELLNSFLNINHYIVKKMDEQTERLEHLEKDNSKIPEYLKQIDDLNEKLQAIYGSRTYKVSKKISNLINRKSK